MKYIRSYRMELTIQYICQHGNDLQILRPSILPHLSLGPLWKPADGL